MGFSPVPESTKIATIRPLTKGMRSDIPAQDIEDGGFSNILGLLITPKGMKRRTTFSAFAANATVPYEHRDYVTVWGTSGVQGTVLITSKTLFRINPITGFSEVAWGYSDGTITVSGTSVTGSGTSWSTNDILPGDVIRVGTEEAVVSEIEGDTSLTLESADLTDGSGLSYSIQRTFAGGSNALIDWAVFENKLLIADGKRPLMVYDPETISIGYWITDEAKKILATETDEYSTGTVAVSGKVVTGSGTGWSTSNVHVNDTIYVNGYSDTVASVDSTTQLTLNHSGLIPTTSAGASYQTTRMIGIDFIPNAVGVIHDATKGLNRVWVGYTYDVTDGWQNQRIRFSALADTHNFSISTNYIDLPYLGGKILKILPLGDTMAVHFSNGLFIGKSSDSTLLPLDFRKSETGGIGLAGVKAVCPYLGGQFYVGTDDIYYLGVGQTEPKKIGSKIVRDTIKLCKYPERIYAMTDYTNNQIVFGFPMSSERISKLAYFSYQTDSWSMEDVDTTAIANPGINFYNTWNALTGTWDTLYGTNGTWNGLEINESYRGFYIEHLGAIYIQASDDALDFGTEPLVVSATTKDHDFDMPDTQKVFTRFSLKIDYDTPLTSPLVFRVTVSTNKGRSYKNVGILTIPAGSDEGSVSFRATGSTVKIKIYSTSQVTSYYISEYAIRVRVVGDELFYKE